MLDMQAPGWRQRDAFILTPDCEKWRGNPRSVPSINEVNHFCDELHVRTGLTPIAYLPGWVYGSEISGLLYPWWQSSYVSGVNGFHALYPGDSSWHWSDTVAGRSAAILQYSSSATIGGQTTCDANAFRGTVNDLKQLVNGGEAGNMTTDIADYFAGAYHAATHDGVYMSADPATQKAWRNTRDIVQGVVGGPVDQSAIIAAVTAQAPALAAQIVALLPTPAEVTEADIEAAILAVLRQLTPPPVTPPAA